MDQIEETNSMPGERGPNESAPRRRALPGGIGQRYAHLVASGSSGFLERVVNSLSDKHRAEMMRQNGNRHMTSIQGMVPPQPRATAKQVPPHDDGAFCIIGDEV